MKRRDIYSAAGLEAYIEEVGFLPLLSSGIDGFLPRRLSPMTVAMWYSLKADGTGLCGNGKVLL